MGWFDVAITHPHPTIPLEGEGVVSIENWHNAVS